MDQFSPKFDMVLTTKVLIQMNNLMDTIDLPSRQQHRIPDVKTKRLWDPPHSLHGFFMDCFRFQNLFCPPLNYLPFRHKLLHGIQSIFYISAQIVEG